MGITEAVFRDRLSRANKIRCDRPAVLKGEGVYHVLAVYDDAAVALKYYDQSDRKWRYIFEDVLYLYSAFNNKWIDLRQ